MSEITDQLWMLTPDGTDTIAGDIPVSFCEWTLEEKSFHVLRATGSYGGQDDLDPTKFLLDARFEVRRFIDGVGLGIEGDTQFFLRYWDFGEDDAGLSTWTIEAYSPEYFFTGRVIDSWASTDTVTNPLTTKTDNADDVLKAFVSQNIGPTTTLAARLISEITMDGDEALAPSITKSASYTKLFDALKDISDDTEGNGNWLSWGLVASGSGSGFTFRTWLDHRGVDHSEGTGDEILVSKEIGNLLAPRVTFDHREEITAVRVLGKGEGESRETVRVEDTARSGASPWAYREATIDSQGETTDALTAEANAELQRGKPARGFTGKLLDGPETRYGDRVKFGDLVAAEYAGLTFTCRLSRVHGEWSRDTGEVLDIELVGEE